MEFKDLTPEEQERYKEFMALTKKPPEYFDRIIDSGMCNNIITGYIILVLDNMGIKSPAYLEPLFDRYSAKDARERLNKHIDDLGKQKPHKCSMFEIMLAFGDATGERWDELVNAAMWDAWEQLKNREIYTKELDTIVAAFIRKHPERNYTPFPSKMKGDIDLM